MKHILYETLFVCFLISLPIIIFIMEQWFISYLICASVLLE